MAKVHTHYIYLTTDMIMKVKTDVNNIYTEDSASVDHLPEDLSGNPTIWGSNMHSTVSCIYINLQ